MTKSMTKRQEWLKSLGLVLVFVGMQFGTAVRNVFPTVECVNLIMIISVLLIVDFRGLFHIRMSKALFALLCVQLFLLTCAIFSSNSTSQLKFFHIYVIVFIIAMTSNRNKIRFTYFGKLMFWISGFISVIILFQATRGLTGLITTYEGTAKLWLEHGGDPITLSRALGINIVVCLFYKEKTMLEKTTGVVFVVSDIIGLLSFGNRSVITCSVLICLIWYFKYYLTNLQARKIFISMAAFLILGLVVYKIPYFQKKIVEVINSAVRGIQTLLNINVQVVDESASTRVQILNELKKEFDQHIARNIVFGMGYNHRYVDRPLIQAFFDFGFLGFCVYFALIIWIPLREIYKTIKTNIVYNDAWIYIVLISIQSLFDQMLTGLPYFYFLWTPAIFILFSIENSTRNSLDEMG